MMNKKILIAIGILILLILSVFMLIKIKGKPDFGECKTDADCNWCGRSCVKYDPDAYCAMVMPPQGYICVCKNNQCKKVNETKEPVCGNQICETDEDGNNCPEDCCISGDGKCPTGCTPKNDDDCKTPEVKVETICTDGIDNDGDGLTDNDDGDCWIRDGATFMEDFRPLRTFTEFRDMLPLLKQTGVKTIELFGLWDHCNSQYPGYRWATRDFYKLDPLRGSEEEFNAFVDSAHDIGIKIVPMVVSTISFPPSAVCEGKTCQKVQFDFDGQGGALYKYWQEDQEKNIFLKNKDGEFVCDFGGYGLVADLGSKDVITFFEDFYNDQVTDRKLDGIRIDTPIVHSCIEGEKLYYDCSNPCICPDPAVDEQNPLLFYKKLAKLKKPHQVFMSEGYYSDARTSDWFCEYPYYPPDTDLDEVAEVSEGYEFENLLSNHILKNPLTSSQFVDWINNQPVKYHRQRFRMIRNANAVNKAIIKFVAQDKRYYTTVTLASTIPGVPKFTDYELFGNKEYDNEFGVLPTNTPESRRGHWEKILNIRNNNNALKYGSMENVWKSGENTYAYSRTYEDENVVIIINFNDKQATSTLNIPFKTGDTLKDELSGETFKVTDSNNFQISVPAYGSRILVVW